MHDTRRCIIDILHEYEQATVTTIVEELSRRNSGITPVTVRHHLNQLQKEGLVTPPDRVKAQSPGRPQHMYRLTEQAKQQIPHNYPLLLSNLIGSLRNHLSPTTVNVIIEDVAEQLARDSGIATENFEQRLDHVVAYLSQHGYEAFWQPHPEGYTLHTCNCPYRQVSSHDKTLCQMDMSMIAKILGRVPRVVQRLADGNDQCVYLIPKI